MLSFITPTKSFINLTAHNQYTFDTLSLTSTKTNTQSLPYNNLMKTELH
jgi:hypothetical protein